MEGASDSRGRNKKGGSNLKDINGNEYYLTTGSKIKDFLSPTYSKVIKRESKGKENVFWDNEYSGFKLDGKWSIILGIIFFYIIQRTHLIRKLKKGEFA